MHPIDVAAQRVDLAVMRDIAVWMPAVPARECIGAEPRMNQRESRFYRRMIQVSVIRRNLLGHEHAFIDERLVRKARNVKPIPAADLARIANHLLGPLPNDVQLSLECHVVGQLGTAPNEHLPHKRLRGLGRRAQRRVVRGNVAPAKNLLSFLADNRGEYLFALGAFGWVFGHIQHTHAIFSKRGQGNTRRLADFRQKRVRHLNQNARAIASVRLATASAAVIEVDKNLNGLANYGIGFFTLDINQKAHPTRIMLEPGVVKALLRWRPCQRPALMGLATGAHYIDCDLISYYWSCKYKFFYLLRKHLPTAITQLRIFWFRRSQPAGREWVLTYLERQPPIASVHTARVIFSGEASMQS